MASNAKKKERHRLKRRQKQRTIRRVNSVSPYKRIARSGEVEGCWYNRDWRERGQAVIFVLRRAPGGGLAMAGFLVDLWCAGLKDAWGRLDIMRDEFEQALDQMDQQLPLDPGDLETARHIVLGAIRFAVQNGFRLPPRYERWVSFVGGTADWQNTSLDGFGGPDGKLVWVAPRWDLERRLIGCTVQEFLSRDDVEWVFGEGDFEFEDEFDSENDEDEADAQESAFDMRLEKQLEEKIEQTVEAVRQRMLDRVRQWCFASGRRPHPRLNEGFDLLMESMLQVRDLADEIDNKDDSVNPELVEAGEQNLQRLLALEQPQAAQDLTEAIDQLQDFLRQYENPQEMWQALGMVESD